MRLSIELGSGAQQTITELSAAGTNIALAVNEGLYEGGKLAARNVIVNHLKGQDLRTRTGNLARAVDAWMASQGRGNYDCVIGVRDKSAVDKYKYLLGDEVVTITAKNGKYLAIPLQKAQTGAGVLKAEFQGPLRQTNPDLFVIKSRSGALLLAKKFGKTDKSIHPVFILKRSVTVVGTGALLAGVLESVPDITNSIQKKIDEKI